MGRGSPRNATVSLTAVVADVVDASDCEHPSLDVETDVVDVLVVDDSAEITQPRHGSGLGVWVAKRVRESCGGRLTFEESPLVAVP